MKKIITAVLFLICINNIYAAGRTIIAETLTPGKTDYYVTVRQKSTGYPVFNGSGVGIEGAFDSTPTSIEWDGDEYDIPLTEDALFSGSYYAAMPANVSADGVIITLYQNSSPTSTDLPKDGVELLWNGTALVEPGNITLADIAAVILANPNYPIWTDTGGRVRTGFRSF